MEVVIGHIGRDRAIEEVREKRELREAMRRVVKLKGSAVTVSGAVTMSNRHHAHEASSTTSAAVNLCSSSSGLAAAVYIFTC